MALCQLELKDPWVQAGQGTNEVDECRAEHECRHTFKAMPMSRANQTGLTIIFFHMKHWHLGSPRNISVEIAHKWMHELGFEVVTKQTFVDGYKCDQMIKINYCGILGKVSEVNWMGFRSENASDDAKTALPTGITFIFCCLLQNCVLVSRSEHLSGKWRSEISSLCG